MVTKVWYEGVQKDGIYSISPGWAFRGSEDEVVYEDVDEFTMRMAKASVNWIANGPVKEFMNKNGYDLETNSIGNFIDPNKLRDLIVYVEFTDLIDFTTAKKSIFPLLINNFTEETVWEIMERLNVFDRAESGEVDKMIDDVLAKYPEKVAEYKAGKVGLLSMFMGDIMKAGKGKIKPAEAKEMLEKKLS